MWKTAIVAVLATGLMAATCEKRIEVVSLSKLPADVPPQYVECFKRGVEIPDKDYITVGELKGLFARFVASDAAKTDCGRDLIAWYRNLAAAYNKAYTEASRQ